MLRYFISMIVVLLLNGCSHLHPYHNTIQQGNIITNESVNQLKIGMTTNQVTDIMGEPVLENVFNENQFIYVYTLKPNNNKLVYKRVTLTFSHNRLIRIDKYLPTTPVKVSKPKTLKLNDSTLVEPIKTKTKPSGIVTTENPIQ